MMSKSQSLRSSRAVRNNDQVTGWPWSLSFSVLVWQLVKFALHCNYTHRQKHTERQGKRAGGLQRQWSLSKGWGVKTTLVSFGKFVVVVFYLMPLTPVYLLTSYHSNSISVPWSALTKWGTPISSLFGENCHFSNTPAPPTNRFKRIEAVAQEDDRSCQKNSKLRL